MRVQLMSDLHLEFAPFTYEVPDPPADVVVLAGDIIPGFRGERLDTLLDAIVATGAIVILVAGNHEGYGHDWDEMCETGRQLERKYGDSLGFLNDDAVYIMDENTNETVCFVGGTLWTDLGGRDPETMEVALNAMRDYDVIYYKDRRLNPSDTVDMHDKTRALIKSVLAEHEDHGYKMVVVTHHAPSISAISLKYVAPPKTSKGRMNRCFYTPMEYDMEGADYWFYGHTHSSGDFYVGDTRCIGNPRGYPGEKTNFNPMLVIDV